MGGDGGTTILERKYLRSAKFAGQKEKARLTEQQAARWSTCAISHEPLRKPIVCCRLGNLYNREAVLHALTQRKMHDVKLRKEFKHIKNMKCVCTLKFHSIVERAKGLAIANSNDYTREEVRAEFACPITLLAVNGRNAFSTIFKGGGESHVLSARAFKEMTPDDLTLHFGFAFTPEQVLKLNASLKEQEEIRKSIKAERHLRKQKKGRKSPEPAAAAVAAAAALPSNQPSGKAASALKYITSKPAPPTGASSAVGCRALSVSDHLKKKKKKKKKKRKKKRKPDGDGVPAKKRMLTVREKLFSQPDKKGETDTVNLFCRVATHRFMI